MDQKKPKTSSLSSFLRLIKPLSLLGGLIVYLLGVGIARYLGAGLDWIALWLGSGWLFSLQLAFNFLDEYFEASDTQANLSWIRLTGSSGVVADDKIPRRYVLLLAYVFLAIAASLTVIIIAQLHPGVSVFLYMALAFIFGLSYSAPPLKLNNSGYGELVASFVVSFFIPAFAFSLQFGDLNRLIPIITTPLFLVCLAMFLALEMPDYAYNLKMGKRNLMIRIGWRTAVNIHNLLILSAYLVLGLAIFFGLPRFAALAAFLSLPVGIFEIWQMWQIAQGGKPNWDGLAINAIATFGSMVYLIAFAFWTH